MAIIVPDPWTARRSGASLPDLAADPNGVLARTPTIVSQFPDPLIATIRCGRQRTLFSL
jgi:hypothetical protein